jgi:hypothetical protein
VLLWSYISDLMLCFMTIDTGGWIRSMAETGQRIVIVQDSKLGGGDRGCSEVPSPCSGDGAPSPVATAAQKFRHRMSPMLAVCSLYIGFGSDVFGAQAR